MRIVHVIHSIDPRSGGPSYYMRNLLRHQVAAGHEVALVTTDAQKAPRLLYENYCRDVSNDPAFSGVELFVGKGFGNVGLFRRFTYSPSCTRWFKERFADPQRRPEIAHIHGVFSHITHTAALLARRHGVTYTIRPTGALDEACLNSGSRGIKRLYRRFLLDADLRGARLIDATSRFEAEQVRRRFPGLPVCVTPQGAAVPCIDEDAAATLFYKEFPQLRDKQVVLYLGRIVAKKRPELLVEALALLRSSHDVHLIVAGNDDGHRAVVQNRVDEYGLTDCVHFAGFVTGPLKQAMLFNCDVFALPSIDENFCVAVLEAMAYGLPVLVTAGVATHVYVDESRCGITARDDAASIAEGLESILSADHRAMGLRGRQYVLDHLTWESVRVQIDRMYAQALNGSTLRHCEQN